MPEIYRRVTIGLTKKMYEELEQREKKTGVDKTNQIRKATAEELNL